MPRGVTIGCKRGKQNKEVIQMSKKVLARVLSLAAAVMMVLSISLLCSCNRQKPIGNDEPIPLPLEEERTISYWTMFSNTYSPEYTTYADHPFFQRLKEKTNINIEFVLPTTTTIGDALHEWEAIIAAGDTTDMVSHFWFVPQLEGNTIDAAAEEGVYHELTEYVNVQMENFNALREQYAVIDKLMITPYNNIMYIPSLTGVEDMNKTAPSTTGLMVRADFLEELQMEVPTTVDEWYTMLSAFKTQLGVENPYWLGTMALAPGCVGDAFITCYGQAYETYLDENGKVRYGAIEEGTKNYVTMMAQWVSEGLVKIDVDITRADKTGDEVGSWGGDVTDIVGLKADAVNPNYELVAAPYPVLKEGDTIDLRATYMPIGNREINSIYICQSYDDPALAAKWIDQLFSEESYMEASYGIEGDTYTVDADGNISFTEKITDAEGGYLYGVNKYLYLGSLWAERDVMVDMLYADNAKAAVEIWSQATSERNIIRGTSLQFTAEENDLLSSLGNFWMTQTGTLRSMIQGNTDLAEWDNFVASMNDMGMEEYIAINQAAWDRYLAM